MTGSPKTSADTQATRQSLAGATGSAYSDEDVRRMVFTCWLHHLGEAFELVASCLASQHKLENTPEVRRALKRQMNRIARAGGIRKTRYGFTIS